MFPDQAISLRLRFRRPRAEDAGAVFSRYAGDAEVTRYLGWPTHTDVEETRAFLRLAEEGWQEGTNLPYLVERIDDGLLLGSTGLIVETPGCCTTGYVLARDAWGHGYATESLATMLELAFAQPGISRVYALCDAEHGASARVMEKCGMSREGVRRAHTVLPNLSPHPRDMLCYASVRNQAPGSPLTRRV